MVFVALAASCGDYVLMLSFFRLQIPYTSQATKNKCVDKLLKIH